MTGANADSIESRCGRQANPRRKQMDRKIALPQSLDSWAIRTRLVYGHRSAEINERFELLQGELRATGIFADGRMRTAPRRFSRRVAAEPLGRFANYIPRVLDDSRATRTDNRRDYLVLVFVIRTNQHGDINQRWLRGILPAASRHEAAADERDRTATIKAAQLAHRVEDQNVNLARRVLRVEFRRLHVVERRRAQRLFDVRHAIEMSRSNRQRELRKVLAQFAVCVRDHRLFAGRRRSRDEDFAPGCGCE